MHDALEKPGREGLVDGGLDAVAPVDPGMRHSGRRSGARRVGARIKAVLGLLGSGLSYCLRMEHDYGHLFLFMPVFMGAGAAFWFVADNAIRSLTLLLLLFAFAGLAGLSRHHNPVWHHMILASTLSVAGALFAVFETARLDTVMLDSPVTTYVSGIVEAREQGDQGEWRYVVRIGQTRDPVIRRPPSRVALVARGAHTPHQIGADIEGRARLSPPSGPALPGLNDFAFSAYFDGNGAIGFFLGAPGHPESAGLTSMDSGLIQSLQRRWTSALLSLRGAIGERIRSTIGADAGAFAAAIVTGERRALPKTVLEDLRRSGLAHVIAISGLHMALAAGLFFIGLRVVLSRFTAFAQSRPIKKYAAAGALVAALAYLMISGAQVSAQRAFVMMAIMLVAVMLDRPAISMRNVALAAIIILAIAPSEVMGPSFQMSFAATVALVAGYSVWRRRSARDGYLDFLPAMPVASAIGRIMGGLFLTSVIGGLSTAIFALEHFHRLAGYSLATNLLAMPIISFVVMPAGLVAMLLMPLGLDALPLHVMGHGLDLVIAIAHRVAGWGGDVGSARLPGWMLPIAVSGMLILALLRSRIRHMGTALIAIGLLAGLTLPSDRPADLLIYEDGRLVGLTGGDATTGPVIATNRLRPPGFIFSQWQGALQRHIHEKPAMEDDALIADAIAPHDTGRRYPDLSNEVMAHARTRLMQMLEDAGEERFSCLDKVWCVARLRGHWRVVALEEPRFSGLACDLGDIVISARRLMFEDCRSGASLVTVDMLRKTGSLEIRLPEDASQMLRVRSSLSGRPRPWSLHRRFDWRSGRYDTGTVEAVLAQISGSGG